MPLRFLPLKPKPFDLFGEKFTYAMRIQCGQAIQTAETDFEAMSGVLAALHDAGPGPWWRRRFKLRPPDVPAVFDHYLDVLAQLERWTEREKELRHEPTPEERRAGVDRVGKELGHFATIDALAMRLGIGHDDVLLLPYSTVFLILKKDLLEYKYQQRLNAIHDAKRK